MQAEQQLEHWRSRLNTSGLPVFSRTVREINHVSTSRRSSAQDLSDVIGHDASMAARVIQIANSPLFNFQGRDIDTINAAVVLVGFDAVRDLVISVSVIEEMLKGRQHARVSRHMARAFHAAAQARSFAKVCGDKTEDVFVATLLKQVGAMAFWSRAEREAMAVEAEMEKGAAPADAERKVLGFELSRLSQVLANDWHLGELVVQVLDGHHADDRRVQHVQLGHDLARVLEQHEWGSDAVDAVLARVAEHLNLKPREVEQMVRDNLDAAAAIAERFGVPHVQDTLPELPQAPAAAPEPDAGSRCGYDAARLLEVIGEIADGIEQDASRDVLMQRVVDGLQSALGFARAYFALFTPDRTRLVMKYVAGEAAQQVQAVTCAPLEDPVFEEALQARGAVWYPSAQDKLPWHGGGPGMAVAVRLAGQTVGILCGEPGAAVSLNDRQQAGFKQLGQQVALILAQAAN